MLYKWNVEKNDVENVKEITPCEVGIKEIHLQKLIVDKIETLIRADQLFVIMEQRARQEEPDILALDENGRLFIFELKRWESRQENILQVLRYGQKFGRFDYEKLAGYYKKFAEKNNKYDTVSKELEIAHKEFFELEEPIGKEKFNKEQKFVIVANGKDYDTWEARNYWKEKGVDIDILTYRLLKIEGTGDIYLDFDPYYGAFSDIPQDDKDTMFIVNTNKTWAPNAYKEMIKIGKAAAYGDKKHWVNKIKEGASVCLYHSGVGVIAVGKATSDWEENGENENFVKLEFESCVDIEQKGWENKAVKAWEINKELNTKHCFRQISFRLPLKIKDFIVQKLKERNEEQNEQTN